jgi:lipopolysaccharide biosynthesis glycosyltransferase
LGEYFCASSWTSETSIIGVSDALLSLAQSRFKHVFTKFQALKVVDYRLIIVLDPDLIVFKNVDDLFGFTSSSAIFRGNESRPCREQRLGETYFSKEGEHRGGLNAGVMEVNGQMLRELKDCVKVRVTTGPKQDYLSDYYRGKWLSLHHKYNFHPNQLKYVYKQLELEYCCERQQALEDVATYHFSTDQKLRDFLFARGGTFDDSLGN